MNAFDVVFVDELLWAETDGLRTIDHSKDPTDPDYIFWLKVILLFFVADYPGLAKCSSFLHSGFFSCHWCKGYFYVHSTGHQVCIHNRRNLRSTHPYRTDPRFGPREKRGPVPLRTRDEVETVSKEVSALTGPDQQRKEKSTGIKGFCMFLMLSMFDIVWDMMPDMMHITKGIF